MSELVCGRCGNPERLHTPKPQTDDDGFGGETWYHWHPFQPAIGPRKALNLDDTGQNFAGVATIRAAIADLLDAGWQCGKGCDLHHPWCFPTEMFSGDREPTDGEIELRGKFADAVIARIAELQNPPHSGVKLENLCPRHRREVLPAPTATVCRMCEAERKGR